MKRDWRVARQARAYSDAVTAYGRRLHRICVSLGDFTVSVLRLATSPYLCFAWRHHRICASLGDLTVSVLRLSLCVLVRCRFSNITEVAILTPTDHPTGSLANTAHFRSCQENLAVIINLRQERTNGPVYTRLVRRLC